MWPRCSTRRGSRCGPAITVRCRSCGGSASSGPPARASRSSTRPTGSGTSWPPSPNCGRRCRRRSMGVSHPEPRDAFVSPRFGQVATFMLLPAAATAAGLDVALVGIPYDGGVSYRTGARFGPRAVREQSSLIRPWHPVLKVHPFERLRGADCGDVDLVPISIERTYAAIEQHGIEVVRIETVKEQGVAWVGERFGRLRGGPVYCSFDIDAVDPAYAPATGTPEVGGLTSYEAQALVRALAGLPLVGADIVEVRSEEHTSELQSLAYLVCRL